MTPPVAAFDLCLGSAGVEETDDQQRNAKNTCAEDQHTKRNIVPDAVIAAAEIIQKFNQQDHAQNTSAGGTGTIDIQRQLVQSGGADITVLCVTGGCEKIDQRDRKNQKAQKAVTMQMVV